MGAPPPSPRSLLVRYVACPGCNVWHGAPVGVPPNASSSACHVGGGLLFAACRAKHARAADAAADDLDAEWAAWRCMEGYQDCVGCPRNAKEDQSRKAACPKQLV